MDRTNKKAVFFILIIILVGVAAVVCSRIYTMLTAFHYEEHLDEEVVTVDDVSVTLREFGYYIYTVEAYIQEQALLYNSDNPNQWWNTHFSAGLDSAFVCDYAKESAVSTCVCYEIYYQEAVRSGLSLDAAQEDEAAAQANEMLGKMNDYQRAATGLNEEMILEVRKKQLLASNYITSLAQATDFAGYLGEPHKLLNWNGEYYTEKILPNHTVLENYEILDHITFGKITVNYE